MQKLIYVASPYSNNPQRNFLDVLEYIGRHKRITGEVLFSPIIYGHTIAVLEQIGIDFKSWQDFDLMMLSKSDELWVLMLVGWKYSEGVNQEIEFAKQNGIKIRYIE